MGLFDWFKKKEKAIPKKEKKQEEYSQEDIAKLQRKIVEATKNIVSPEKQLREFLKKMKKEQPTHVVYQDVKNSEEFQARNNALSYSMIGEYSKAIKYATKGIKINPKSAYLYFIRGSTKGERGLLKEGLKDLNKAIKLKPNFSDAYRARGYIKKKLGNTKGAEEDDKKAEKIEPLAKINEETGRILNK